MGFSEKRNFWLKKRRMSYLARQMSREAGSNRDSFNNVSCSVPGRGGTNARRSNIDEGLGHIGGIFLIFLEGRRI